MIWDDARGRDLIADPVVMQRALLLPLASCVLCRGGYTHLLATNVTAEDFHQVLEILETEGITKSAFLREAILLALAARKEEECRDA